MKKGDYLSAILRSPKTVFSFKDIALLWNGSGITARVRLQYYLKNNDLYRIRQGLYAKNENYDKFELATKIYIPAYIGFETVLGISGITFQYYNQIFLASYLSREVNCNGQIYTFHKIKDEILTEKRGLINKGEYWEASKERAFLDTLYLNKNYHFDNLSPLNWNTVFEILPIYKNIRMSNAVYKIYKNISR